MSTVNDGFTIWLMFSNKHLGEIVCVTYDDVDFWRMIVPCLLQVKKYVDLLLLYLLGIECWIVQEM